MDGRLCTGRPPRGHWRSLAISLIRRLISTRWTGVAGVPSTLQVTINMFILDFISFAESVSPRSVSAGNEEVAKELVGAGADVNQCTDKGLTPL